MYVNVKKNNMLKCVYNSNCVYFFYFTETKSQHNQYNLHKFSAIMSFRIIGAAVVIY